MQENTSLPLCIWYWKKYSLLTFFHSFAGKYIPTFVHFVPWWLLSLEQKTGPSHQSKQQAGQLNFLHPLALAGIAQMGYIEEWVAVSRHMIGFRSSKYKRSKKRWSGYYLMAPIYPCREWKGMKSPDPQGRSQEVAAEPKPRSLLEMEIGNGVRLN